MKVRVTRSFVDKYSMKSIPKGTEFEVTEERFSELTAGPRGIFVEEVKEEPPAQPPLLPEDKDPEEPTEQSVENESAVEPLKEDVIIGVDLSNDKDMTVINGEIVEKPNFEKMVKADIVEYAKGLDIELNMEMTKVEMIEILLKK